MIIKQPSVYIDYGFEGNEEVWDRSLINCECGRVCERGIGQCDPCLNKTSDLFARDLEVIYGELNELL